MNPSEAGDGMSDRVRRHLRDRMTRPSAISSNRFGPAFEDWISDEP